MKSNRFFTLLLAATCLTATSQVPALRADQRSSGVVPLQW